MIELERQRPRTVASYAAGTHWPTPYLAHDGWRCHDCGRRLRTYVLKGLRRLRHYSGDRRG